jgi:cell division septal protein FtsQ
MSNTIDIQEITEKIKQTAPKGARVEYQFPGYVSIVLSNDTEIAFGDSLEKESGYSWNNYDKEGASNYADSFEDLADIEAIVKKLWEQTAPLTKEAN